jgi:hypothetical protein
MNLIETVENELLKMYARNVVYCPAPEELPGMTKLMVEDLRAAGLTDADSERVTTAFIEIALNEGHWPNSYMVKKHLPKKVEPTILALGRRANKEIALKNLKVMREKIFSA